MNQANYAKLRWTKLKHDKQSKWTEVDKAKLSHTKLS